MLHCGFHFLFCVVSIVCISLLCGESFHMNKCVETERRALIKFKDSLAYGEDNPVSSWNGEECCKWEGLSCDNLTGHVISLNLQSVTERLQGKLDSSICVLQHLTSLNLSGNSLEGNIPKCIGSLGQLIELDLSFNPFVGVVPPSLGNLSKLQTLDLKYNFYLSVNDLEWISHLSNLRFLDLSYVNLTLVVDWLSPISKIPSLSELHLADCGLHNITPKSLPYLNSSSQLVGVVPPSLGNLSKLQTLDLGGNYYLSVNDLEWLSHLSNLRFLDLSDVNLTLVVDWLSSISQIPSLSELHLADCGLHNITPKSLPYLNSSISLNYLDLSDNSLNSSILPWVINVSKVLTHLDLSSNSLQPSIPYEFGNMTFLQYLRLSYNEFQGSIPKSFRSMCQLKELYLNSNKLSGQLSDNIQQLCCVKNGLTTLDLSNNPFKSESLPNLPCFSSLVTLRLSNTNLVGLLPKWFVHWPFLHDLDLSHNHLSGVDTIDDANISILQYLDLSFNQLSGSMPLFEITKLTSLQELYMSHNQLNESLPLTTNQLSSITTLSLSSNKLNGVINETHLSNLSQLLYLDVSQNSLSFNFSLDWVPPFKLEGLFASSCLLGPKFPVWLKHQREISYLEISNTGISDSFPNWFWNLSSTLKYVNVSRNKLNGPLPKSLLPSTKVSYVYVWDFSFNHLNGSLPPFPELSVLFLSNNKFTGSLSSFCTSLSHRLIYLDLSSNLLAGKLTDCWEKFQSLEVLNLEKNNLSGKIPNSFDALQEIESLHLNNNNFSGEIPSLIHCQNLKLIDVGNNNLQGKLPKWVGDHLPKLIVIRLRENKFQGNIPTNMCNLLFLQVLDLSTNNITGEIPQCFGNILALSNLSFPRTSFHYSSSGFIMGSVVFGFASFNDKAILALKGSDREYNTILGLVTTIDLSCNHLTGEIPQSITKLVALFGLNLSRNNLTGFIPSNIGHMKRLESLDLSINHLSGRMPISFSSLTFLAYMNLSFNNLEGRIPLGTQLQSFDSSSYMGNNGLCGPPLINYCPEDVNSSIGSHDKQVTDEDEDKFISFGFYVSLGLGFIIGFWGVCGTLVIKTSWRHSYFKFFKKIND